MAKELVKKAETTAVAVPEHERGWGTGGTDTRDILIPKILGMQGLSRLVADGKAAMGDIVNSVTGEILGNMREVGKKPLKIIPITTFKTWVENVVTEIPGQQVQKKFKGIVPMTPENADLPFESIVDGKKIQRDRTLNFYVLVEGQTSEFPYLLSFRRTSFRAGQKLATHFIKCEIAAVRGKPVPPAATMFSLTGNKVTNEKGTFYVFDIEPAGPTASDDLKAAYEWFQILKKAAVRVDHSDLEHEVDVDVANDAAVATERF